MSSIPTELSAIPDEFYIGKQGTSERIDIFTDQKQACRWLEATRNHRRLWRMEHDLVGGWHATEMELVLPTPSRLIVKGSEDD
jgi:hypothetical protein